MNDLSAMSSYDRQAWEKIQRAKRRALARSPRALVPAAVRERAASISTAARRKLAAVHGVSQFEELMASSLTSLFEHGIQVAFATLDEERVIRAYRGHGFDVSTLRDIRLLDLADIDQVIPKLGLVYASAASAEGAAVGLVITGSELLTAVGAGGVGPAGVIGAVAADAAAVLVSCFRLVAHTGMYYGHDIRAGEEEASLAFSLLGSVFADDARKLAAYREVSKVSQKLLERQKMGKGIAWLLDKATGLPMKNHQIVQFAQRLLKTFGFRTGSKQVLKLLPFMGGAGQNAHMLNKTFAESNRHYREMFLRERYDIDYIDIDADGSEEP